MTDEEKKNHLLLEMKNRIKEWRDRGWWNHKAYLFFTIIMVLSGALTPLTAISAVSLAASPQETRSSAANATDTTSGGQQERGRNSPPNPTLISFGYTAQEIAKLSCILAFVSAVAVGLNVAFRFSQKWHLANEAASLGEAIQQRLTFGYLPIDAAFEAWEIVKTQEQSKFFDVLLSTKQPVEVQKNKPPPIVPPAS